uniref:DDE Tnp4 domain-containing protein n=1 Tax=Brassica oleracea var. oleracea TaxID=109376 RepID=A0A0D3BE11_BRAOL
MDPNNLPSKSSSYVGLLHSQQGSVFHENFPYESFHSSVNFGESQPFPAFSSQQSQDAPLEPPVQTPAARGVRRKWNPADDEVLISAWLNTSKDAIRQLAYGGGSDTVDEYVRIGETTARRSLHNFAAGIIDLFGDEYLRRPTPEDLQRLLYIGEQRGFPGMIGSIDCMHWEWKNCPTAWKGMYSRGTDKPTIVLEAVASYDLWIWHAFFGAPGTMNDLNILDRSPVFDDIINGIAPQVNFAPTKLGTSLVVCTNIIL